jgi:hypothetical protein
MILLVSVWIISIRVGSDREGDRGIPNHTNTFDKFITAYNKYNGNASNYDALI